MTDNLVQIPEKLLIFLCDMKNNDLAHYRFNEKFYLSKEAVLK